MYTVMNRIEVTEGMAEGFEKGFSASMNATLPGVPGLLRSTLLRPAKPGQPYVSVMEFTDEDAFRAWMGSESFRAAHKGAAENPTTGASVVETFDTVTEIAG
ncbi:antibiotic biosynthesis monooxygenase [Amycolatopsis cynarae]|uniref:Antibiotic biosynthesis monooxygenase n=2 Tax=Amycolatopsis TaxID=1813 RepID=A0A558C8P4_9PSEU|nr:MULTISPECIES: antibiotic biosynthesis monooxygenase [Amycolatopsis]TVT45155.1 antibiotic biosynthesis monooxygenase [Amycolatopsis rhizosphaerae]WAL64137.1 antibiotic biosynthesis monooxygenase [Amycolatopsis sp. HUAS 11-8]